MMFTLKTTVQEIQTHYFTYVLRNDENKIVFVGYDKMIDILMFKNAIRNPAFDAEKEYEIEILSKHARALEAQRTVGEIINNACNGKIPNLNMTAYYNRNRAAVICDQTGITYQNAYQASVQMGLPQPRISQHLARKPGHKSVKGFTFRYASYLDENLEPQHNAPAIPVGTLSMSDFDKS